MSFDAAYAALKAQHLEDRVRRFPGSSATVALAAQELGTAEGAIAKTMALLGPDGPILVLAAGDRKIDGGSIKRTADWMIGKGMIKAIPKLEEVVFVP